MQLVAYGAQDIYLTSNPQITFFKVVYRRHTNFSMETIEQTVNGTSTLSTSNTNGTVTISRNGDLLSKVYVRSSTPGIRAGGSLVSDVTCEIGGQQIDKYESNWEYMWNELSTPESKANALKTMQGMIGTTAADGSTGPCAVNVPLLFWFCRNPGLALPLIALQYHEVKLKFTWGTSTAVGGTINNLVGTAVNAVCQVFADYIYLDTEERRRFAQVSHEYLIEQHQYQTEGTANTKYKLNFNHPVKELIWLTNPSTSTFRANTNNAKITLNGHDRLSAQTPDYFQLRQPFDHHTAVPRPNLPVTARPDEFVDIFTGDANGRLTLISAEDAAATIVTANSVMVTDLNNNAPLTAISAPVVTTAAAIPADEAVFSFRTSDIAVTPVAGDVVRITFGGDQSASKNQVTTTVAVVVAGALGGALMTDAGNTHMTFTDLVLLDALTAEIDAAENFTLTIEVLKNSEGRTSNHTAHINVYSFALKPEEHQPSGTCNFSRIDTAHLEFGASTQVDVIYVLNYNVLRVMSGMGGLAYSN
jgi:hypothetical protein